VGWVLVGGGNSPKMVDGFGRGAHLLVVITTSTSPSRSAPDCAQRDPLPAAAAGISEASSDEACRCGDTSLGLCRAMPAPGASCAAAALGEAVAKTPFAWRGDLCEPPEPPGRVPSVAAHRDAPPANGDRDHGRGCGECDGPYCEPSAEAGFPLSVAVSVSSPASILSPWLTGAEGGEALLAPHRGSAGLMVWAGRCRAQRTSSRWKKSCALGCARGWWEGREASSDVCRANLDRCPLQRPRTR
jgi:hypothetical protein